MSEILVLHSQHWPYLNKITYSPIWLVAIECKSDHHYQSCFTAECICIFDQKQKNTISIFDNHQSKGFAFFAIIPNLHSNFHKSLLSKKHHQILHLSTVLASLHVQWTSSKTDSELKGVQSHEPVCCLGFSSPARHKRTRSRGISQCRTSIIGIFCTPPLKSTFAWRMQRVPFRINMWVEVVSSE